jgi:GAF domain-containing protein
MARGTDPSVTSRRSSVLLLALAVVVSLPSSAQTRVSPEDVQTRNPAAQFAPSLAGQEVTLRGIVNSPPFGLPGYNLLALQDEHGGAVLKVIETDTRLNRFSPGDEVEATGQVAALAGMAVVVVSRVELVSRKPAPQPLGLAIEDLMGFRYLGRLARTEGRVKEMGNNSGGSFLTISTPEGKYRIFIPRAPQKAAESLPSLDVGDKVQVTGVSFQYCPQPPYNNSFELLVNDPSSIMRLERRWIFPPWAIVTALSMVLCISFLLWSRERRLQAQRERLRKTYQIAEEILGASSPESIVERLSKSLPGILGVTRIHLYTHNRVGKTLDLAACGDQPAVSISLSAPPGGTHAGAVACFHYRTLLVIPDIDRSPFPIASPEGDTPKSLLFVPMMAQGEVVGVLELDQDDRIRDFTADEQELAQHLGNQVGVAVRLLDQRSVQEQLFRTEKLAAVGRLISGVVNELQAPLASICDLANRALERIRTGTEEREVAAIAAEAKKAAAIVARLVSFAGAETLEARPVAITNLLHNLIDFREGDWKASGIRVRDLTTREPLFVLGSQGQLEQVFLNLLVHAEQALAAMPEKVITLRTSVLGKRLLVEIAFTGPSQSRKAEETAAVLGVTRSVIAGHGGEVRLVEKSNAEPRFEVELPALARERISPAVLAATDGHATDFSRRMTALVIEPDEAAQRQILGVLASRGYRVVPVANSDTGLELAQRMRFDAAFCSVHAPGLNWVELSERMQGRVGGFILVSDGYDPELSADFEGDGRFVLPKPIQEPDLERILRAIEPSAPAIRHGAA